MTDLFGDATTDFGLKLSVAHPDPSTIHVGLAGELDLSTNAQLEHELLPLLFEAHGCRIVLDLSDLSFIDSTGLRTLWRARQDTVNAGGTFLLESPSEHVMRVLRVTKLDKVFQFVGDPDA